MTHTKPLAIILIGIIPWLSWLTYRTLQEPRWQEMYIEVDTQLDEMRRRANPPIMEMQTKSLEEACRIYDSTFVEPDTLDTLGVE
jgi:hypothetical protein